MGEAKDYWQRTAPAAAGTFWRPARGSREQDFRSIRCGLISTVPVNLSLCTLFCLSRLILVVFADNVYKCECVI